MRLTRFDRMKFIPKQSWLYILSAVVALGLLIWFGLTTLGFIGGVNRGTYQIVTLETGDAYIGKLRNTAGAYIKLTDVYYQQREENASINDITVVPLSSSVARPDNVMYIARDKIVHWENLSHDSKIVQVIESDSENK